MMLKDILHRLRDGTEINAYYINDDGERKTRVTEVDMTRVAQLRNKAKDQFQKREGAKLTFLPFFANDVDGDLVFAQQVFAYGNPGDILVGISTSGNSKNVSAAMMVGNAKGLHTMALAGRDGGRIGQLAEVAVVAPQQETYRIQEDHLAIYHLLCAMVEYELFDE